LFPFVLLRVGFLLVVLWCHPGWTGASCLARLRGGGHLFVEPLTRALAAYSAREPAHL